MSLVIPSKRDQRQRMMFGDCLFFDVDGFGSIYEPHCTFKIV